MERSAALRGLQTNYLLCPSRRCPSSPPLNSLPLPFADNTLSSLNFQVPLFPLSSLILFGDNSIFFFFFWLCSFIAAPKEVSSCFSKCSSGFFSIQAWCRFIWYLQVLFSTFIYLFICFFLLSLSKFRDFEMICGANIYIVRMAFLLFKMT